ncbi:MAG: TerB N-terminal domain-containing protein [Cyanobacteria bacterium P01_A01_bin.17]
MLNWLKKLLSAKPQPPAEATSTSALPLPEKSALPESELAATPESSILSVARWVLPGEAVTVADYTLTHGLIYIGDSLAGIHEHVSIEPCLISPQLKVDSEQPDHRGEWMTHWPSYSEIPSGCRAAYLEWLAAGRTDPEIHVGYVFLFLYGLERRVLHDLRDSTADYAAELTQIMNEVERLMVLYGHSESFSRDAANFLEVCWLLQSPQELALRQPPGHSVPLQLTLGKLAQAGKPLPAHWALAWVLDVTKAKPSACLPELHSLFRLRYHDQLGDGVILDGSGPMVNLTHTYQPATVSFGGPIEVTAALPEFTQTADRLEAIQPLVESCVNTLESYCRWLSRNLELWGSYAAVLQLPSEIAPLHELPQVSQFRQWATGCLSEHEFQVLPAQELFQQWTAEPLVKLSKADAVLLSQFLETQGIGVETDARFGGKPLKANQNVVLFRLIHGAMVEPSSSYSMAQLLLHLAALVVVSEEPDVAGMAHVQRYLAWTPSLQEPERDRLLAYFQWLCCSKPTLRGLKTRLANVSAGRKVAIAKFLISVAKARGEAQPEAIDILTKLYPLLGFEAEQVYRQLHSDEPLISAADAPPAGVTTTAPTEIGLNLDLIQRRQDESQAASAILSDIFVEEPEEPDAPKVSNDIGLDEAHAAFLLALAQQPQWEREALEKIAVNLNLMLDGALENINEIAFDQCDEALIEGDKPFEVNPEVLEQLLAA